MNKAECHAPAPTRSRRRRCWRLGAAVFAVMMLGNAGAAELEVTAQAFKDGTGRALLRLFAAPEGFPKDSAKAIRSVEAAIEAGQATAVFDNLAPGEYAVAVAHDANLNGELDFGMFGIPAEGYGFSRDAKASFGPPSFEQAKIRIESGHHREVIRVRYGL